MAVALNWQDLEVNGWPAHQRALQALTVAVNRLESEQRVGLHQLEERLATLEFLMSEELMREMLPTIERKPVIVEMAAELARLREDLVQLQDRGMPAGGMIEPPIMCDARSPASRIRTSQGAPGTGGTETAGIEGIFDA